MSVARVKPLKSLSISSWLAELHMECYKRNLENYDTIKPLLDMKDNELKKLGIQNSRDRAMMLGSLATYKTNKEESSPVPVSDIATQAQETHKSLLRKSSLKKINLKGLLGSGSSKKGKKKDTPSQSSGPTVSTVQVEEIPTPSTTTTTTTTTSKPPSSDIADYEELLSPLHRAMTMDAKVLQTVTRKAIENEYVPSPENSPRFDAHRFRAQTMDYSYNQPPHPQQQYQGGSSSFLHSQSSTPEMNRHTRIEQLPEDDKSNLMQHKHLSVISMESGLSFGYDVEKDFNPALPLEVQPWFHGKISRTDAENMLNDDGDFLVRENTLMPNTYTLTQRWQGKPDHTLIDTTEVVNSNFMRATAVKYQFEGGAFDSIPELIFNHFKYQIPIEKTQHTLITNPICRASNSSKGGLFPTMGTPSTTSYAPTHHHQQHHIPTPDSSPTHTPNFTLPRNFGSKQKLSSPPPEALKTRKSNRPTPEGSPRNRSQTGGGIKHYNSSGDILEATAHDSPVTRRNVISPPPSGSNLRIRAMTTYNPLKRSSSCASDHAVHVNRAVSGNSDAGSEDGNCHTRMDSFGDYEVMESVSILNGSSSGLQFQETRKTSSAGSSPQHNRAPHEKVKYAEVRYNSGGPGGAGKPAFLIAPGSGSVKYAEVRFAANQGSSPHPFSTYDSVPIKNTSPYQSRAEILAQKYSSTPNPSIGGKSHTKVGRQESSPHPFSQYSSIHYASIDHLSRQSSVPTGVGGSSAQPMKVSTDPVLYAIPDLGKRKKDRESTASNDSALSTASSQSSPGPSHLVGTSLANIHSHAPAAKVHRSLPGYDMLVKLHTVMQTHSNEELAYHLTRADATCFMLSPRPGEDTGVWKDRVKQNTSSSGFFTGLQTLADPDGEKLWKKLYYRHLNFSQMVSLSIVSAGDALERTKMLRRFIKIASLLQSGSYGNLFSFIATMQGIATPQITDMQDVWDLLKSHYSESVTVYKDLQGMISNLNEGISMYSTDQLTVPAIQHLKTVFHFSEQCMHGFVPITEDRSLVGEYSSLTCGLDGIHTIVANVARFSFNARRKLDGLRYDASLMDFFMQDTTRLYLQSINVHVDSPIERRRRFGVLLNALVERVESCESV